jgi:AcrR family transcriptional regulator
VKETLQASRLDQLMSAAAKVFISRGYRRAAMSDIAKEMGVAPGTIYLYVESKEALFHLLALHTAINPGAKLPEPPIRTPPPGTTMQMLRKAMTLEGYAPRLASALRTSEAAGAFANVEALITELYDSAYERRTGINLIEKSAIDWPELADVFYEGLRAPLVKALSAWLERGIAAGAFRPVPDLRVAARFIVETIAWFAIHRHGDPRPKDFSDDTAREGVINLVTAAIR